MTKKKGKRLRHHTKQVSLICIQKFLENRIDDSVMNTYSECNDTQTFFMIQETNIEFAPKTTFVTYLSGRTTNEGHDNL